MKKKWVIIAGLVVLGLVMLTVAIFAFIVMVGWVDNPFGDEEETGPEGFLRIPDKGDEPVFALPLDDGSPAEIRFDSYTGVPAWISGPIPAPPAATRQESAVKFFKQNKDLYQMTDPAGELAVGGLETDATGMTHVSIDQVYKGVPVFGSDMKVHFSADGKNITAVNGRYFPGIDIDVEPGITAEDAIAKAKKDLGIEAAAVPEKEPAELVVLTPVEKDVMLTWRVVLTADNPPTRMVYFVDGHTGEIIYNYSDLQSENVFETYTANNKKDASFPKDLELLISNKEKKISQNDVAQQTYKNTVAAYNYFYNTHGRNSFDNKGATVKSVISVQFKLITGEYYKNSATWNMPYLLFGDGSDDDGDGSDDDSKPYGLVLDVVAHEFTHAVTNYSANLIYTAQSGALNESYSDVFACMIEREDWLIGEDLGKPMRSLSEPSKYGDPEHMDNYKKPWLLPCNDITNDNCHVHTNSGIPNKAAYNVASDIGKERMEKIWYRALTVYLTNTSQFNDARSASEQAAKDLFGDGSSELEAVKKGFSDVGIGGNGSVKASARIEIDHDEPLKKSKYLKKQYLVVSIGVGDPGNPKWSKKLDNEKMYVRQGVHARIDISEGEKYLDPSNENKWFLKVEDKEDDDAEGSVRKFTIFNKGNEFQATNLPADVKDKQTTIVYIPSSATTPTPEPKETGGQSDTVLVMDVSGSMGESAESSGKTKMEAAKAGAQNILSMIRDENLVQGGTHRLGLVSFTDTAKKEQSLGGQYATMEKAIMSMSPQSGTNLGDGLQTGLNDMTDVTSARARMIIILSDGMSNTGMSNEQILNGPVAYAKSKGIKIYTVGFGSGGSSSSGSTYGGGGIDEDFLKQIASRTGGEYYNARQYFELENIYIRLRQQSRGEVVANLSGTSSADTQEAGTFNIKIENGELHGTVNWEEGATEIALIDPDGREVDSEYPGAYIFKESKPAYVVVKNPQPGAWKALVKSAGESGGAYDVVVSAQEGTYRLDDYPWALALISGASILAATGMFLIFRRPFRSSDVAVTDSHVSEKI